MDLSIVVPVYNEGENLPFLYESLTRELAVGGGDYEIILVDDGSTDDTFKVAEALSNCDKRVTVIKLRRNYGQTPAMAAGIDHARGEIIITMDGDLQNDPSDIPRFIDTINGGYDIVVGWRYRRQDELIWRKIPSKVANWIIGKVTGVPIKDNGCSLKAYRAEVIKSLPMYSDMHRFIPAITLLVGARIAEIKVKHHARRFGVSKYGLSRIYKVIIDLLAIKTLTGFGGRPLFFFYTLAIPALMISFVLIFLLVYDALVWSIPIPISFSGILLLLVSTGAFLFFGGLIAELIYKTGSTDLNRLSVQTKMYFGIKKDSG